MTQAMKKTFAVAVSVFAVSTPALAHHPLGGLPMETFTHGVLSGVGHPVLGFDHLFFVLIVGIAALFTGRKYLSPAFYIAAMLVGTLMMSGGFGLPAKELVIGLSLLVIGGLVLAGHRLALLPAFGLFAFFGLFHGSAFGDSIAAQEAAMGTQVLVGYLIGLGAIQYALAVAAGWVAGKLWQVSEVPAVQVRLAGAVAAGIGLFLTLENVEGIIFDVMGWAA